MSLDGAESIESNSSGNGRDEHRFCPRCFQLSSRLMGRGTSGEDIVDEQDLQVRKSCPACNLEGVGKIGPAFCRSQRGLRRCASLFRKYMSIDWYHQEATPGT